MASGSAAGGTISVLWITKLPRHLEVIKWSPLFYMGAEYFLQMKGDTTADHTADTTVFLSLKYVAGRAATLFRVMTFVRDLERDDRDDSIRSFGYCSKVDPYQEDVLWSGTYQGHEFIDECEIVCVFLPIGSSNAYHPHNGTIHLVTDSTWRPGKSTGLDSLSADFGHLFQDKAYSDVTLQCGDHTTAAHRVVLSSRSDVFAAMFRSRMAEREAGVVRITDIHPWVLEPFLKYIYTGKIPEDVVSEDVMGCLYSAGDKYAITSLQSECSRWIIRNTTRENCLRFLVLADMHSDEQLRDQMVKFIVNNVEVFNGEEWSLFKVENPTLAILVYDRCIAERLLNN